MELKAIITTKRTLTQFLSQREKLEVKLQSM